MGKMVGQGNTRAAAAPPVRWPRGLVRVGPPRACWHAGLLAHPPPYIAARICCAMYATALPPPTCIMCAPPFVCSLCAPLVCLVYALQVQPSSAARPVEPSFDAGG
jgi:hypothetical protein